MKARIVEPFMQGFNDGIRLIVELIAAIPKVAIAFVTSTGPFAEHRNTDASGSKRS